MSSFQATNCTDGFFKNGGRTFGAWSRCYVAAKPVAVSDASGLGLLRVGESSKIVDFVEKPTDIEVISRLVPPELKASGDGQDRCLASMGIYVFNARAMEDVLRGDTTDFGKEIIPSLVGKRFVVIFLTIIVIIER